MEKQAIKLLPRIRRVVVTLDWRNERGERTVQVGLQYSRRTGDLSLKSRNRPSDELACAMYNAAFDQNVHPELFRAHRDNANSKTSEYIWKYKGNEEMWLKMLGATKTVPTIRLKYGTDRAEIRSVTSFRQRGRKSSER